jgi:hypothetical protein
MALNVYEPLKFRSQGISDLATQDTLLVTNGKITVANVEGTSAVKITANSFSELENKGFSWSDGRKNKGLFYKKESIYSDLSIDLDEDQNYKISNTTVLSLYELGNTVVKSNLKTVGTLKTLKVAGNGEFGEFFYISSDQNKIGINNDSPQLALGIRENGVDLGIGSSKSETGIIGTLTSSHLDIVTDNKARITVYRNGEVRVHGRLTADEIHTEKTTLLIFKETETVSNYGKGLMWANLKGPSKQFVLHNQPERFYSTESLDLPLEKSYMIDGRTVLNRNTLGPSVTTSSLTSVGVLTELQVAGDAAVTRRLSTSQIEVGNFVIDEHQITFQQNFSIKNSNIVDFELSDHIVIGNYENLSRPLNLYGNVTIGVSAPQDGVALTVDGPVSFQRKKFEIGSNYPSSGQYNKGDIVWNDDPKPTSYIGWVCITPGTPGIWAPFGAITRT